MMRIPPVMETVGCEHCGASFQKQPSSIARFCSHSCANARNRITTKEKAQERVDDKAKLDAIEDKYCPKCLGQMWMDYVHDERYCVMCGYRKYLPHKFKKGKRSIVASGRTFVIRYVGKEPNLLNKTMHIYTKTPSDFYNHFTNSIGQMSKVKIYGICPFCNKEMEYTPSTAVRNRRYETVTYLKCPDRHRVILYRETKNDSWDGWA